LEARVVDGCNANKQARRKELKGEEKRRKKDNKPGRLIKY
jgi:hypothetical protein